MPKHYEDYHIENPTPRPLTDEDIETILQWKSARSLTIDDNGDISLQLFQHAKELGTLPKLTSLSFNVNVRTYNKINLAGFIENIPTLTTIALWQDSTEVQDHHRKEFLAKNPAPEGWYAKYLHHSFVYYSKY